MRGRSLTSLARGRSPLGDRIEKGADTARATRCGEGRNDFRIERADRDLILATQGHGRKDRRDAHCELALGKQSTLPLVRHAATEVERHITRQVRFVFGLANEMSIGPGVDSPIHPAKVVARGIFAKLNELSGCSFGPAPMRARKSAAHAASWSQRQPLEHLIDSLISRHFGAVRARIDGGPATFGVEPIVQAVHDRSLVPQKECPPAIAESFPRR